MCSNSVDENRLFLAMTDFEKNDEYTQGKLMAS
jgi:hypothetical protein